MRLLLDFLPTTYRFDFVGKRVIAMVLSAVILLGSVAALATKGLNFGIDFAGGLLIEVQTEGKADLGRMRAQLGGLGLGEVALQSFGDTGRDVMIRVQRQDGGEEAQIQALETVQAALGEGYNYRRVEIVGPKVGDELREDGIWAVTFAMLAIAAYVWFRFEWQFGLGGLLAIFHDVIATLGFFAITGLDFNLTAMAALLTIAGYSINDTVVVYDRVRENLRKYKSMEIPELLNLSVNEMLNRTILTSGTTLLAVAALAMFGGEVLKPFSLSVLFGIVAGTYSSIYIGLPVLLYFNLRPGDLAVEGDEAAKP